MHAQLVLCTLDMPTMPGEPFFLLTDVNADNLKDATTKKLAVISTACVSFHYELWVCPEQACLAVAAESSCDDIFWAVPYSAVGCGCEQLCQLPVFYIGSHANAGTLKPVKSQP